jgi:O-antigen/teichoic acid export membrane protein
MKAAIPGRRRSVVANFLYSSLSSVLNALVPLLTYPYIARVLGPDNMGKLGVAGSLSGFFLVAGTLGLPIYGVRLVARNRNDPQELGRISAELAALQMGAAFLSTVFFAVLVAGVPRYRVEPLLFTAFGATILVAGLNFDWFLQGVEEFKYIGLRNTVIKALTVFLVFFVVRVRSDYIKYSFFFALYSFVTIGLNAKTCLRHVRPTLKGFRPFSHLGAMGIFTLTALAVTAYTNLDFLFLGLVANDGESGFYNISIRLVRTLGFITATLSGVLLPRLSTMAGSDEAGFSGMLRDSFCAILLFALPSAAGIFAVADDFIRIFAGSQYTGAGASLRITALIVPVAALSNFLQVQVLVPRGKETPTLLSFAAGILAGSAVLFALVRPLGHVGAAFGMLAAECAVLAVQAVLVGRVELARFVDARRSLGYLAGALLCGVAASIPRAFMAGGGLRLLVSIIFCAVVYIAFLAATRDDIFLRLARKLAGAKPKTPGEGGIGA